MGKRRLVHARWIDDAGSGTFHVEGPGFIANFTVGLRNREGQEVVSVSVSADGDRYKGDPQWWAVVEGDGLTPKGVGFRIVKTESDTSEGFPVGAEVSLGGGNIFGEVVPNMADDGKVRVRWPNGNQASYLPAQLEKEV